MKKISVVISTYNRQAKILETVRSLSDQTIPLEDYEIIIIDNGSDPAFALPDNVAFQNGQLIRFEKNSERVAARNKGVEIATGELVLISDDDMIFQRDFLEKHINAHKQADNLLVVGRVILPPEKYTDKWIKFRQEFEFQGIPSKSMYVENDNFCTAQNMSIRKEIYMKLGGFDNEMTGIEDQDFAIRHKKMGGEIIYLFEAIAVHDDDYLEFNEFCFRLENASRWSVKFGLRYPEREEVKARILVNGPIRLGKESIIMSLKKLVKQANSSNLISSVLGKLVLFAGNIISNEKILGILYKFVISIHIQKGFRSGLADLKQDSH